MNTSGTTLSTAISTEHTVRDAYKQSSPRQRFNMLWKEASIAHRCLLATGVLGAVILVVLVSSQTINGFLAGLLLGVSGVMAAIGMVGTERKIFAEHFKAYGAMLQNQSGEPSKLRYLCFIDLLRDNENIHAIHLERLIPTIQSQIEYRGHFFRRHPVLALLTAIFVMLITSGLAQPVIWSTALGVQLLIAIGVSWGVAWLFGREWRRLRPNHEARERELLAFLHMAVQDLSSTEPAVATKA